MRILIAGGTGTAGRVLAVRAREAGHLVRVLSRSAGSRTPPGVELAVGDLTTGAGLDEAAAGVDAVVDVSNRDSARESVSTAFFRAATEHLFAAEQRACVGHHLTVSIVGLEGVPMGYYRAKLAHEAATVAAAGRTGVGHTIARITQFHDFAPLILRWLRLGPLAVVPRLHLQPVHLRDVADHLLGLLDAGPSGRSVDLGGPQQEELADMVRRYVAVTGVGVRVLPVPVVGPLRRFDAAGALRPADGARGSLTFDDWLRELATSGPAPSS